MNSLPPLTWDRRASSFASLMQIHHSVKDKNLTFHRPISEDQRCSCCKIKMVKHSYANQSREGRKGSSWVCRNQIIALVNWKPTMFDVKPIDLMVSVLESCGESFWGGKMCLLSSFPCLSFKIGKNRLYYWTLVPVPGYHLAARWICLMHTL